MKTLLSCILWLASCSIVHAGGSITLADIQSLLQQQPELWHFFSDRLDIDPHGGAARLSGPDYTDLRGTRVGPYVFRAKPTGSAGGYVLEVRVQTDISWLDDAGKEVGLEHATKVKETLEGVELRRLDR